MKAHIYVGTCGFSRSRRLVFSNLDAVEIQQTFYDPPPPDRLARLRREAPDGFTFTVKAWMLVTHRYNKMLWKRLHRKVPGDRSKYGFFQDTGEVWWAWSKTLEAAKALRARIIVLQSPASFRPTMENIKRIERFLSRAPREGMDLAWEPRGEWWDLREELARMSRVYEVIIVGDFLRGRVTPCVVGKAYARLHGLGGKEANYRYKYTNNDLAMLKDIVNNIDCSEIYIMFNNIYSYDDALRFKSLLEKHDTQ